MHVVSNMEWYAVVFALRMQTDREGERDKSAACCCCRCALSWPHAAAATCRTRCMVPTTTHKVVPPTYAVIHPGCCSLLPSVCSGDLCLLLCVWALLSLLSGCLSWHHTVKQGTWIGENGAACCVLILVQRPPKDPEPSVWDAVRLVCQRKRSPERPITQQFPCTHSLPVNQHSISQRSKPSSSPSNPVAATFNCLTRTRAAAASAGLPRPNEEVSAGPPARARRPGSALPQTGQPGPTTPASGTSGGAVAAAEGAPAAACSAGRPPEAAGGQLSAGRWQRR